MVDAAVRTATTHSDDEAPRIDVERVGDLLLGNLGRHPPHSARDDQGPCVLAQG